jgi:uncharacterized membrane protein
MNTLLVIATVIAALGSGLIAGIFFAFSSFIMGALGRLPPACGIAAMQSINIVVLNPVFLAVFMGTGLLSIVLVIAALLRWSEPGAAALLAGGVCYVVGTFGVTIGCNVPLNDTLAAVEPDSVAGAAHWTRYRSVWTAWNHLRTAAALAASAAFIGALMAQQG